MVQLILNINDGTDSDNYSGDSYVQEKFRNTPNTRVMHIDEPRQVSWARTMSSDEKRDWESVAGKLKDLKQNPRIALLTGSVTGDYINSKTDLSADERSILRKGVSSGPGPMQDAKTQAWLTAWDKANFVANQAQRPHTIFVDFASLERTHNPVNFSVHTGNHLVLRTAQEIKLWKEINRISSDPERHQSVKSWFDHSIEHASKKGAGLGASVEILDREKLYQDMKQAEEVTIFVGASLGLVSFLLDRGMMDRDMKLEKVKVIMQGGSMNSNENIFGEAFNFALDKKAAKNVFCHVQQFGSFTLIPTQTARKLKFSVKGLVGFGGDPLLKLIEAFNDRQEETEVALLKGNLPERIDKLERKNIIQSDLAAFMLATRFGESLGVKRAPGCIEDSGTQGAMLVRETDPKDGRFDLLLLQSSVTLDGKGLLTCLNANEYAGGK
ncbi:hypothetical protein FOXG_14064 [Fusarium oxysporum f. sp. lycopersici 4287]|uniref:Uncharacterized protein n=1 Tax=Fusarium oxysporum f. sp. lycopersici (strain 4287 / CBS 123668 / FGSC 9935 / NRRL 34936) TaxID=426428 RepID=A0A0J9VT01_FUSO4|nr:hypothetical protein FOXG_12474 [Fusarium oxysporum f. sp. lycopersici 4287]XP_018251824.1 hypothetical protein FOXG_12474 [Fusarium oxysporum f. sp. lycopersici 4287]XP_018251825.1 hypothetical protein FOXG_12474 [Fusarium oxysporum f. sp. lycopersici 4287]XP_018253612.1 hypothetical protein FOXG_14064 [Fusarium oxysporum f. sp. lycopersici 4287]EWZ78171.1 hypothetical protein FOWG_17504 [Fusarium oxysporum f. sp. lycopersici MN25]EWZ78172.1 hypothetical protein FOWG_17504 [Fusarium oxyspo